MQHDHLQKKKCFYLLIPSRGRGWVKRRTICLHSVLCFIPVNLICNMTIHSERKSDLLTPHQGSRVFVRAKYLLACYCMLIPFNLICNYCSFTISWLKDLTITSIKGCYFFDEYSINIYLWSFSTSQIGVQDSIDSSHSGHHVGGMYSHRVWSFFLFFFSRYIIIYCLTLR